LALAAACAPSTAPSAHVAETTAKPPARAGALRVGTSGNYPPWSTWKVDHAEDFAGALLGAFARDANVELAWTRFRWPDLVRDLREDRFDVAADGITVRPERSVAGRFTVPVARGGAVLLLRRPAWAPRPGGDTALGAIRVLDRPELRVGVNRGGHLERVARSLFSNARVHAIDENDSVRNAFAREEVDAVMTNTFEAPRWKQGLDGIETIGPLTHDVVALYVRADEAELGFMLDTWLLAQEDNGALERLRARHLGPGGGGPIALPLDALLHAIAERLSLMPLVAAAKQRVGKAVEDPTQEARVIEAARAVVVRAGAARGTPPLPIERIDAFFHAQMEAAKALQQRSHADASTPAFSLEQDLRPAIARITERIGFLVVRLPHPLTEAAVMAKARDALAESGLGEDEVRRLVVPIAALAE
jgi:cyclohexadienyl dehydratase